MLFLVLSALLTGLVVRAILQPLCHPDRGAVVQTMTGATVAVYRRQLAELHGELRSGGLTDEQFQRDRDELERRLALELPAESRKANGADPASGSRLLIAVIGVGLPLTAAALYLLLGTPPL